MFFDTAEQEMTRLGELGVTLSGLVNAQQKLLDQMRDNLLTITEMVTRMTNTLGEQEAEMAGLRDQIAAINASLVTLDTRIALLEAAQEPEPTPEPEPIPEPTPEPAPAPTLATDFILMPREQLMALPTSGAAWDNLLAWANKPVAEPDLSNQDDNDDIVALAKAMVFARTGEQRYRNECIEMLQEAIGTEYPGDTLGVARNYCPLVLAANFIGYDDELFLSLLASIRDWHNPDRDYSLVEMHEKRPNNWGSHSGAGRIAIDVMLSDEADLQRAIAVFRGYLGERDQYAGFKFGADLSWHLDPAHPVGVNPAGATKDGKSIDGVIPDDKRRGGSFPNAGSVGVSYTWEGLQGVLLQAELLHRQGYPAYEWSDQAVLRAFRRAFEGTGNGDDSTPIGDDSWQPWIVNKRYGTTFPAVSPARPGKAFGFTDWLFGS